MAGRSSLPRPSRNRAPRRPYAPRLPPEERKEQLLDAALAVIIDQGFHEVSIEAVARIAGVTRPVVYDHFPNLARLLAALIEREEHLALAEVKEIIPADPGDRDPGEVVIGGVRRFLQAVENRPSSWRLILLPLEGTPAIVRDPVESNRAEVLRQIEGLVQWGLSHDGMPDGLDVDLAARAIMTLGEEAGRMLLEDPDKFSIDRYVDFAASIMALIWLPK
jgi:AcrR family transcriptional regulator